MDSIYSVKTSDCVQLLALKAEESTGMTYLLFSTLIIKVEGRDGVA